MALTFTVGSGLAGPVSECIGRRSLMCASMFLITVAMLLIGSNSLPLTWTGLALNGFIVAGVFIPMVPEIMYSTELSLKNSPDKEFIAESEPLALTERLGVN